MSELITGNQFQAGNRGRPIGSKNKSRQLLDAINASDPGALQEIVDITVKAAKQGKPWAICEILSRAFPVPKGRLIEFPMPAQLRDAKDLQEAIENVMQECGAGLLTSEEAEHLCSIFSEYVKPAIEHAENLAALQATDITSGRA
jgi:hypothetical protein